MNVNEKVEYLKQFLNKQQLDYLDYWYPNKEYTLRTVNQIEKTIKAKDQTVKQLLLTIDELETKGIKGN